MEALRRRIPYWIVGALLISIGAGAAVGPVLAARLTGKVAIIATQALTFSTPLVAVPGGPPLYVGGATGTYLLPVAVPGGTRTFSDLNDQKIEFTVSVDLLPTSSKFDILVPMANSANNQVIAQLTLEVPDQVLVDVERLGSVVVTTQNAPVVLTTTIGGQLTLGRTSANTWEIHAPPLVDYTQSALEFSGAQITAYNGLWLHVGMPNGTPPGFYQIKGKIEPMQK